MAGIKKKNADCIKISVLLWCRKRESLRRFRDDTLKRTAPGRAFVRCYYALSPSLVRRFGETAVFRALWRSALDRLVNGLRKKGVADTPYADR